MLQFNAWTGGLAATFLLTAIGATPAAVIFDGAPTGQTNGTTLDSLPQWTQSWKSDNATGYSGTLQDNKVQLTVDGTASGGAWRYLGFRADSSQGVAQKFDPTSDVVHFQTTIDRMIDSGAHTTTTYNDFFALYLTPENYTSQPFNTLGEKIAVTVQYNYGTKRGTGASNWDPGVIVSLAVINKTGQAGEPATDTGTIVATKTFYYTYIDRPDGDPNGRGSLALDLQWDNTNGFRLVATPIYPSDVAAGSKTTPLDSGWIDPTTAANASSTNTSAFASDWKSRWNGNTNFYIENSTAPWGVPTTNLSLLQVTQNVVPEPAGMALIGLLGAGLMARRRRK